MKNLIFIILPLALLSMLTGIYIGFIRIGWAFPVSASLPVPHHGILMAGSFLGTLISVERVSVLKTRWVWLIPILMISSLFFLLFQQDQLAFGVLLAGSIGYLGISFQNFLTYKLKGDMLMLVGAFFQIVAFTIFIFTHSYPMSFAGWLLFFLLTIVGERLNLTRFLPVSRKADRELYTWFGVLIVSSFLYHFGFAVVVSLCLWGIAQWLLRNDIALVNIRKDGHYKFLGAALIGAYIWLFITGALGLIKSDNPYLYDALLHAFFIGFVLSMVLAHAPIIFPALLQIRVSPFHPFMYVWLFALHISLFMRVYGDIFENYDLRKLGGLFNGLSFVGYLLTIALLIIKKKIQQK
ncbi:hypothetical protein [Emticicia sp. TH156]|uniref:hypothetical protein n=1 Tax=Emticicia sp. TH156 TaxID=2067454 RepID=UPI000C792B81|nr:hypothetical protein [Emticicia sp. TH156]PLK42169.1 hypothetical protein C0V77_22235 [Emticicia sp. TH156]